MNSDKLQPNRVKPRGRCASLFALLTAVWHGIPKVWRAVVEVATGVAVFLGLGLGFKQCSVPVKETSQGQSLQHGDLVDYNALSKRFPIGFIVFRGNSPFKQLQDLGRKSVKWDVVPTIRKIQPNRVEVKLGVNFIHSPEFNISIERLTFSVPTDFTNGATAHIVGIKARTGEGPSLYFHLLDADELEPVYVFGFGFQK